MGGEGNEYARGGRQIHTNKPEVQAKEKWVYVKRAVKGRIRMELRIREVDKSGRRRRVAGPFDKLRDRGSFITVSELVELAVISCARSKAPPVILRESGESINTGSNQGAGSAPADLHLPLNRNKSNHPFRFRLRKIVVGN